ncbi:MAG: methyltransferase domain-containing protein [Deltaproteobacteria bacterium]|nr:methyltransferase domain-containing protein [Kofleriaceae bacterium]
MRGMPSPADMYESMFVPAIFRPLSRHVLALAAPKKGERVLDLACGTGIVARQVAPLVGAEGRVVALDLRPGMLAAASKLTVPYGAAIEWVEGDATRLDLAPGSFDLVVCQQGMQFFPDRAAAAAGMKRVLASGGRAVIACWRALEHHPLWSALAAAEMRHLAALGADASDATAPFALGDADELRGVLEGAGLRVVEVVERTIEVDFPAGGFVRDQYLAYAAVMPQFVADPAAFDAFVAAIERDSKDAIASFTRDGRVRCPMPTHIATAR